MIAVPGDELMGTEDVGYIRGHGTRVVVTGSAEGEGDVEREGDGAEGKGGGTGVGETRQLVATVVGVAESVNRLVAVNPVNHRYLPEIGDLVVGRIAAVAATCWTVDIQSSRHARLMLSAVNLPGGVQRIRTYEDQLQMRSFFNENDLISAEVQNVGGDGSISLHTRSLKYGKLTAGFLVTVPPALMRRLSQHYVSLPYGVDVILGRNGRLWITGSEGKSAVVRLQMARVRNAVEVLRLSEIPISPSAIMHVYDHSLAQNLLVKDMLRPENIPVLGTHARTAVASTDRAARQARADADDEDTGVLDGGDDVDDEYGGDNVGVDDDG